jgi:hypothetical protein
VATSEITLSTGDRREVEGTPNEVEAMIVGASRGSIMQLAWLTDALSGERIAINPDHLVALRAAEPSAGASTDA